VTIPLCVLLCPANSLEVVIEVLGVLREVGQIHVRKIDEKALHITTRQLDKVAAHSVAHATRTGVKHEPDLTDFIQANLDEVISGPQRSQMICVVAAVKLGVLGQNRIITRLQLAPNVHGTARDFTPCATVAHATMVGTPVRHSHLDGFAHRLQIVRQLAGIEAGSHGHHAATDIDTHRSRNNRTLGRDHAAHCCTDSPVHIGHCGDPLKYERHLRSIEQLLACLILHRYTHRPGLYRYALLLRVDVIVFHCRSPLYQSDLVGCPD
jgi:hypothetical protein